jgi:hypothetical protein
MVRRNQTVGRLLPVALLFVTTAGQPARARAADPLQPLYRRIATDLKAGRPLTITAHVALCDNRAIWCGSKTLGVGDDPRRNLYWGGAAGLRNWFDHRRGWKRVFVDRGDGKVVLERVVYRYRVRRPPPRLKRLGVRRGFDVLLLGLAYRGTSIGQAMGRFVRQVSQERGPGLRLPGRKTVAFGGRGHVVGYLGHNHLMDVRRYKWPAVTRTRHVGYFGLACMTAQYLARRLTHHRTRALLLTRVFMYPGAFTLEGLARGLAAGLSHRRVFLRGARMYARYQKRKVSLIRRIFTYSGRPAFQRRYGRRPRPGPRP